jgi:hypothetical protein
MSAKTKTLVATAMLLVAAGSCNVSDLQEDAAPVTLVLSSTQNISRFDLAGNAPNSTACNDPVALVQFEVITKNPTPGTIGVPPGTPVDPRFNTVQMRSYRVSYVRTDGGRQVPAPFVRSLSAQILPGGAPAGIDNLVLVQADALNQAPFAALLPNNGGRDPETGRPVVQMDIIIEAFGETLAGENVSGVTRVPLDFCFSCGGCD